MAKWREFTFPIKPSQGTEIVIEEDRSQILADPLRLGMLEILEEGKTVTELSEALNVTDARVLYHVRRLAEAGIVKVEDFGDDCREWRCLPAAPTIRFREDLGEEDREGNDRTEPIGNVEAIPADVAGQFNQAFREATEGMYGLSFQVSINHNRARLSEAQAADFNRRLLALIEDYFPPGKGDRSGIKYGFYGMLTPIDLHPLGDAVSED
ncbi:MAG: winged helix-turn-helix domain-containing protein [Caldilineaceae bacterium]|nr:winged helix-turn-helix domain-containing protein [Caldilineaceae bacterium]